MQNSLVRVCMFYSFNTFLIKAISVNENKAYCKVKIPWVVSENRTVTFVLELNFLSKGE